MGKDINRLKIEAGGKRALICGVSGQDGSYLARLLLDKNYEVFGSSRDAETSTFKNLERLDIKKRVNLISISPIDFRSVSQALVKIKPDEVYYFAGQSSVGLSFEQPVETLESITIGTLSFLEAIRFIGLPIKFYNAGSGECFGDAGNEPADEKTSFRPRSPYAVAKAASHWEVANYREAYNLFALTGILFNHESPLRPERFVTKKIVSTACRIASGSKEKLHLGNIEIERDWGWAPEYVEAMWLMLQQPEPEDFVIATGETRKLRDFVDKAFACSGLNWHDHVIVDPGLFRPTDLAKGKANPQKAREKLKWQARSKMDDVVDMMVDAEVGEGSKYQRDINA